MHVLSHRMIRQYLIDNTAVQEGRLGRCNSRQ